MNPQSLKRIFSIGIVCCSITMCVVAALAEPVPVLPPTTGSAAEPRPDPIVPIQPAGVVLTPVIPNIPLVVPELPKPLPAPVSPVIPVPVPQAIPVPAPADPMLPPVQITPLVQPMVPSLPAFPTIPANPEINLQPEKPLNNLNKKVVEPAELPVPKVVGNEIAPTPKLVDTTIPRVPTPPEDHPMLLTTKTPFHTAILGTALAVAQMIPTPVKAAEPPTNVKDAKAEDLEALKTKLEKEIADLKKDIKTLQERSKDYYETIYGKTALEEGLPRRVEKMETTLADISKRLKALEEKATSTSGSSPLTGGAVTGPKAKIKLINEYAVKVSIVVNGTSYQLDPKQSKELEINSGSFSYQLLIDNAERVTSAVKEGETVTLRIK